MAFNSKGPKNLVDSLEKVYAPAATITKSVQGMVLFTLRCMYVTDDPILTLQ